MPVMQLLGISEHNHAECIRKGWQDPITGILSLEVLEAQHLNGCSGSDEIFVEISTAGQTVVDQSFKSGKAKGPGFVFPQGKNSTQFNMRDATTQRLYVTLKRKSVIKDTVIGRTVLELQNAVSEEGSFFHSWEIITGEDGVTTGYVHITVGWQPTMPVKPLAHGRQGILTVTVIKGNALKPADSNGLSDPYVVVTYGNEDEDTSELRRTSVQKKTLNPIWGDQFRFVLSKAKMIPLYFLCWDEDLVGRDFLGSCMAKVGEAVHEGRVEKDYLLEDGSGSLTIRMEWNELPPLPSKPQKRVQYKVIRKDGVSCRWTGSYNDRHPVQREDVGSVVFSTGRRLCEPDFGVTMIELVDSGLWMPLTTQSGQTVLEDMGTLEFEQGDEHMTASELRARAVLKQSDSLDAAPRRMDLSDPTGVLTVLLRSASDLMKTDALSDSDPYAVLSLRSDTQKSRVIKDQLNPEWNEMFFFAVEQYDQDVLEIALFDDDMSDDDFLGRVSIPISEVVVQGGTMENTWVLGDVPHGRITMSLTFKH